MAVTIEVVILHESEDGDKVYCMLGDGNREVGYVRRSSVPGKVKFGKHVSLDAGLVELLGGSGKGVDSANNVFVFNTKVCLVVGDPDYCAEIRCELFLNNERQSNMTFRVRRLHTYRSLSAIQQCNNEIYCASIEQGSRVSDVVACFSKQRGDLASTIVKHLSDWCSKVNDFVRACFYERCSFVKEDEKAGTLTYQCESTEKKFVVKASFVNRDQRKRPWISNLVIHNQLSSPVAASSSSSTRSPSSLIAEYLALKKENSYRFKTRFGMTLYFDPRAKQFWFGGRVRDLPENKEIHWGFGTVQDEGISRMYFTGRFSNNGARSFENVMVTDDPSEAHRFNEDVIYWLVALSEAGEIKFTSA